MSVEFTAVPDLKIGDKRTAGGTITAIRTSKSGLTAWITDTTGTTERISTKAKIAITRGEYDPAATVEVGRTYRYLF